MENVEIKSTDMILAENQYYSMDCYETKVNNNVLVVGAAGTGKTRSIVTPNLLQACGSYVISDPKGNLYNLYGDYLREKGYEVKLLNFDQPEKSCHYNFFRYIRCEKDILKIAHMMVYNNEGNFRQDPFWDKAGEILLSCIISYLWKFRPVHEQTLESVMKLIDCCQLNEGIDNIDSPFDRLMADIAKRDPHGFTYKQYQKFRVGAIKTLKSILITLSSNLGKYDLQSINDMMAFDDIDIPSIGREKTAIFVVVSDTDHSMDDLANIFYTQAMGELCYEADNHCEDYRLPMDVRFILDDFATNCKIEEFPRMISSVRSRGISAMLMIQAESQLEKAYYRDSSTIIGNCDTYIYLGGNDIDTAENVARRCNLPLNKILYMPVETNWIFRRGQHPVNGVNFKLEPFLKTRMPEKEKPQERDVTLEDVERWADDLYDMDEEFREMVDSGEIK